MKSTKTDSEKSDINPDTESSEDSLDEFRPPSKTLRGHEARYCYNCGQYGHLYKYCQYPITSYGMIIYHITPENDIKFLLIQRNVSPEYRNLIHNLRNQFDQTVDKITQMLDHLTQLEIRYLSQYSYQDLFYQLTQFYSTKRTDKYKKNLVANRNTKLINGGYNRAGDFIDLRQILRRPVERHLEPDWGFPKGRRDKRQYESDLDCAKREAFEETEIGPRHYQLESEQSSFMEVFVGTNGIRYQHTYYLAQCPTFRPVYINPFNKLQMAEIRKIGWFSYQDTMEMFRDYHVEKRELLTQVYNHLKKKHNIEAVEKSNRWD